MGAAGVAYGLIGAKTLGDYNTSLAMGDYQNEMSKINARYLELKGQETIKRGDERARRHMEQVNQLIGSQKAAYAGGGVDVSFGSARQVQEETRIFGLEDAQNIRTNAFLESLGFQVEAQKTLSSGRMAKYAGETAATQSLISGGISAASVYSSGGSSYKKSEVG